LASGIANPQRLRSTVERLGVRVIKHILFRDHHQWSQQDLKSICDQAGDAPIVVTEKDWVKLPESFAGREKFYALLVDIALEEEEQFLNLVLKSLRKDSQS
jgi:tetraacyldisaccharide 4'-kinase